MRYEIRSLDPQRGWPEMNETAETSAFIDLEPGMRLGIGTGPGNGHPPEVFSPSIGATTGMWDAERNV